MRGAVTFSSSLQMFHEPFSCDYRPRFCMETGDLALHVTAANDAALQCNLSLYRLECAEHLPVSGQEAVPAAATLAEVSLTTLPRTCSVALSDWHADRCSCFCWSLLHGVSFAAFVHLCW